MSKSSGSRDPNAIPLPVTKLDGRTIVCDECGATPFLEEDQLLGKQWVIEGWQIIADKRTPDEGSAQLMRELGKRVVDYTHWYCKNHH